MPQASGGPGDLWIEIKVVIPAVTDARPRQLLQEVARVHAADPRKPLEAQRTLLKAGRH